MPMRNKGDSKQVAEQNAASDLLNLVTKFKWQTYHDLVLLLL